MENKNHQLFLQQYEAIHPAFVRYCRSRAFGITETEDLVQESILIALQQFDQIRQQDHLLGYLIGVVNNIIRKKKRRLKFKGNWEDKVMEQLQSKLPDPALAPDIHFLLKAIEQLSEKQKEAILLFEISGLSIKEVAVIQQSSEGATKTRLSRARQELKTLLADEQSSVPLSKRLAIYASILF